jgi:hypothetical protein
MIHNDWEVYYLVSSSRDVGILPWVILYDQFKSLFYLILSSFLKAAVD